MTIRASCLFKREPVAAASTFSFCLPLSWSVWASSSSTEPNVLDELGRGLLPHAGDARDVVGGVALQRDEVEVLRRRHPVLRLDRGGVHPVDLGDAAPVEQHADRPASPSRSRTSWKKSRSAVTITDVEPCGAGLHGERADRVVGLVARHPDHRDVQDIEHLLDQSELRAEVGGGLRPAGLVVGVHLEPHGGGAHVEGHRQQVGMLVAEQLDQHRREAVDRVRDGARAGRQRLRQGEERPVREAVTVQQEESTRGL